MNVSASSPAQTSTNTPAQSQNDSTLAIDPEEIFQLMTVQLQNQDPTEPVGTNELIEQMLTVSSSQMQIETNMLLEDLMQLVQEQADAQSVGQLTALVGMDVKSDAPINYTGSDLTLYLDIPPTADASDLVIRNEDGEEVARLDVALDQDTFIWDGTDQNGLDVPHGSYTFSVDAFVNGEFSQTTAVSSYQHVVELKIAQDGAHILVFEEGGEIPVERVESIRTPTS